MYIYLCVLQIQWTRVILIVMSLSESITSTDGVKPTRPKIIDFKIQRDPGLLEYNSYFFAKDPELTTTTEKRVVSLLGRKVKSRDTHFEMYPTKKFRTLPYESTNKVVREIHLRHASNRRAIVQFKGYTSVPQSEKFIIRRNACHHNEMLKQRDLVQNYIKNNDFSDDVDINTDISPIDTPAEIKLFLPKNRKHINTQNFYSHKTNLIDRPIYFNPNPRGDNSAETEDQKEFIFVKIPRIDYENVDDKKSKKTIKKSIFKHYRLFKRNVIEEEHQATTATSFKPSLDSELTSSLVFNNINT
ncbi:PREDICTED: uncharacterized protein LOC106111684 isoform X2 [Papilio polytes]|uniref:uncharacterized protein LOC106111684 isoform X2 n=1 Tax=Papilio polytes TaxID=76194 RepID=UPI000676AAA7|nr:PREDICTED: uncharacterized protein LOC106111684 isoform X2 [Papilio polytes]